MFVCVQCRSVIYERERFRLAGGVVVVVFALLMALHAAMASSHRSVESARYRAQLEQYQADLMEMADKKRSDVAAGAMGGAYAQERQYQMPTIPSFDMTPYNPTLGIISLIGIAIGAIVCFIKKPCPSCGSWSIIPQNSPNGRALSQHPSEQKPPAVAVLTNNDAIEQEQMRQFRKGR